MARKKKKSKVTYLRKRKSVRGPSERDHVKIAIAYARAAVKDKKGVTHGRLIRLAAARFLNDLKRANGKRPRFIFDKWHANDACKFIELLPHVEGKWDKPTIIMHPSHIFFVVQLFGFRKRDGSRRFTSALFAVARKNAKSTLAAAILLYCECCEEETGAQVISAATTFPQASIIFKVAKRMAEMTPDLREHFGLQVWAKAISRIKTGATFQPIHAKASTQDGLNPSHTALDEIHAHKTPDLLNVLTSAAGARANPLWLYTTTEGFVNTGPWAELRVFAMQLLDGVFGYAADHFLAVFFAVDEDDDEFDEKTWAKSNPLIDVNPHLRAAIRRDAVEAKAMPSKLGEFRVKRLNRQASAANCWVNLQKWKKCSGKIDLKWLAKHDCYGALDLSSTTDFTSWRLVWYIDGIWYTWGRRWVPSDAVKQRTERGTIPYAGWVEAGLLELTEGDVVDYSVIEEQVLEDCERFEPKNIAYDRWNALDLVTRLVDQLPDDTMIEFIQGPKSYHPAMQELERAYIGGKLHHGGDKVLNWNASNLIARRDVNMNMAPDKKKSADKIDDMCALLMGMGISLTAEEGDDLDDFIRNPVIA